MELCSNCDVKGNTNKTITRKNVSRVIVIRIYQKSTKNKASLVQN